MGSGCNSIKINKGLNPISSDDVIYQGEPYATLDICTGDTITEVETAIINKILNLTSDGKDITLKDLVLSVCADIEALVGTNVNVLTVLQAILQYSCAQSTKINNLSTIIGSGSLDFKCITAPSSFSVVNSLQAFINAHCDLQTQVTAISNSNNSTTIINNSILNALNGLLSTPGGNGLKKTVNGTTVNYSLVGLPPPFSYIPYGGPLTNFDSSGKGLNGTNCEGWYLCNGNNGTPDMRGFIPVGAVQGVPGGALSPLVDPTNDASMNYSLGQTGGAVKQVLNSSQIPSHTHTVNDPGHTHNFNVLTYQLRVQEGGGYVLSNSPQNYGQTSINIATTNSSTGITINPSTGGGQPIDVRQPYRAVNYITRFD